MQLFYLQVQIFYFTFAYLSGKPGHSPNNIVEGGGKIPSALQIYILSPGMFHAWIVCNDPAANFGRIRGAARRRQNRTKNPDATRQHTHLIIVTLRIASSTTYTSTYIYPNPTLGTCSRQIDIELEDGIIRNVTFTGGCHGNTQGIAALVRGMKAADAIARLEGIDCRGKGTSCPDQLAKALRQAL